MSVINQSIPSLTDDMTWENWNGNMIHYFGEEPLPYLTEPNWKDFANSMAALPTFSVFALPGPDTFDTWQDWAKVVISSVNGTTS
jgi:hypothetical protein